MVDLSLGGEAKSKQSVKASLSRRSWPDIWNAAFQHFDHSFARSIIQCDNIWNLDGSFVAPGRRNQACIVLLTLSGDS
jgi:hypothetical protein